MHSYDKLAGWIWILKDKWRRTRRAKSQGKGSKTEPVQTGGGVQVQEEIKTEARGSESSETLAAGCWPRWSLATEADCT